ncbi:MAG: hypothetical protein OXD01_01675 [Gammaproteobacteria bacterium]|nr:hypothetical protein [Gammaproteobacteria bacterium]
MKSIYLVSCVARKACEPAAARDLYKSAWFIKARSYVEKASEKWFILSAEHGLVSPEAVINPYEKTLNSMKKTERRAWADKVLHQLQPELSGFDRVVVLAGARYREFLVDRIRDNGLIVDIPLRGMRIGEQLQCLKDLDNMRRLDDLMKFYAILGNLQQRLGCKRIMQDCSSQQNWPQRGVYFFFEPGENRTRAGTGLRVVRVGTHALKEGSKATLWKRLSQHRGVQRTGGGNHRGSIFRLLVGQALISRDKLDKPTWGIGGDMRKAAEKLNLKREAVKEMEHPLEQTVSKMIGAMEILWLPVLDAPGPESLRGYIERNAIALLSNYQNKAIDPPSRDWLGQSSNREKVQQSGLWNSNHVDEKYDPDFLEELQRLIKAAEPCESSINQRE